MSVQHSGARPFRGLVLVLLSIGGFALGQVIEVPRVLVVYCFPPLPVVVFCDVLVVFHEVSDVCDPGDFLVSALASGVAAITVGAEFIHVFEINSDLSSVHWQELGNVPLKLHLY